jgi:hypothetical protein
MSLLPSAIFLSMKRIHFYSNNFLAKKNNSKNIPGKNRGLFLFNTRIYHAQLTPNFNVVGGPLKVPLGCAKFAGKFSPAPPCQS